MEWLEITISTAAADIKSVTTALTGAGFSDLVIEDQEEFEAFLDENRAYWAYIDEEFQNRLQGLSRIKLYLESDDQDSLRIEFHAERHSADAYAFGNGSRCGRRTWNRCQDKVQRNQQSCGFSK